MCLINLKIRQFWINLLMNMLKCKAYNFTKFLSASAFSLCLALSSVTALPVCQVVFCVWNIYASLWDAPVVNTSLPPSLFPSRYLSLCSASLVHIISSCSPLFFNRESPLSSFPLSLFLCLSVTPWKSNTAACFVRYSKGHPFFRTVWK